MYNIENFNFPFLGSLDEKDSKYLKYKNQSQFATYCFIIKCCILNLRIHIENFAGNEKFGSDPVSYLSATL